jgi:protein-disulfide isomerase
VSLRSYAEKLGMNLDEFDEMIADKTIIDNLLGSDMAQAKKCSVRGTPTIFINGLKLSDRSMEGYKKRINEILANQELEFETR